MQPPPPPPPPIHSQQANARLHSMATLDVKPCIPGLSTTLPAASSSSESATTTTHMSRIPGSAAKDANLLYRRPLPCEGCREWRRKCDLTKPSCKRCLERGFICTYIPLRYERKQSRRSPSSPSSSSTSTLNAANDSQSPQPQSQAHQPAQQPGLSHYNKRDSVMSISNIIEPTEEDARIGQQYESSRGIGGLATGYAPYQHEQNDSTQPMTAKPRQQQQQQQQVPSKRGKACTFCHRRKTKCDMSKPACSDCTNRGIECVYLN